MTTPDPAAALFCRQHYRQKLRILFDCDETCCDPLCSLCFRDGIMRPFVACRRCAEKHGVCLLCGEETHLRSQRSSGPAGDRREP